MMMKTFLQTKHLKNLAFRNHSIEMCKDFFGFLDQNQLIEGSPKKKFYL